MGTKLTCEQVEQIVKSAREKGQRPNLKGVDLFEADLRNVDLSKTNLRGARLIFANLSGANLSHANLNKAELRNDIQKMLCF